MSRTTRAYDRHRREWYQDYLHALTQRMGPVLLYTYDAATLDFYRRGLTPEQAAAEYCNRINPEGEHHDP